jgi:hypothetical protein
MERAARWPGPVAVIDVVGRHRHGKDHRPRVRETKATRLRETTHDVTADKKPPLTFPTPPASPAQLIFVFDNVCTHEK